MTDAEIRVAIAEKCRWTEISPKQMTGLSGEMIQLRPVPDYCHDLNAMFDAEETIKGNPDLWVRWGNELFAVTKPNGDNPFACYHANARQRAEALLRTWGLWKD